MPFKNMPDKCFKLWEQVYDASKKSGDDEETSAKKAYGAIKQAGWSKDDKGQWVKKESFAEFSLRIDRASYDKATNERRFRAVASDTDEDKRSDNMSLGLFGDFLERINTGEPVPEEFQSDWWKGGMPYLSVSHYPDFNGKVPGQIEAVYIDGNYLKSKGKFNDTPLGHKCFEAICSDLYGDTKEREDKVRISIAFLDYTHKHKSNGFVFDRTIEKEDAICPECMREMVKGEGQGKIYLKGHLIHLALTRVPVNTRTSMEVDKSMANKILTRKDDAATIVGDELAEEMEKEAELVGKSEALVIRSEEEVVTEAGVACPKCGENVTATPEGKCPKCGASMKEDEEEVEEGCGGKKKKKSEVEEESKPQEGGYLSDESISKIISTIKESMTEFINVSPTPVIEPTPSHPLDTYFSDFKQKFDAIMNSDITEEEKKQQVQEPFNSLGNGVVSVIKSSIKHKEVTPEVQGQMNLVEALSQVMNPIAQKLDLVLTQLSTPQVERTMPTIPQRRSIPPEVVQKLAQQPVVSKSETPKLRAIIDTTV
jgi:ssDNA-binding Zn-finger/Zn-ribbon topoisomerase 1